MLSSHAGGGCLAQKRVIECSRGSVKHHRRTQASNRSKKEKRTDSDRPHRDNHDKEEDRIAVVLPIRLYE
ncbi:hypothetical protein [Nodosilinea sp. P-1105]|uniref:hypothetical protein n=1 Tax=Nodosilinea sp. P-1105 TaxID=2546229 RepID=UPI00146D1910|nr:hypothetical protein [Nodosilinea sp. P-1105]NMF85274.1 hypothetical protein [Nodosilinea sp. P-1105]